MTPYEGADHAPSTRDRIFEFIVRHKQTHDGNSPSQREIAEACHIGLSVARYHLTRLEIENRIRITGNQNRAIEIVGGLWQLPGDHEGAGEADPPEGAAGAASDADFDRARAARIRR